MTPGQLTAATAAALNIPPVTTADFYKKLREAKLIATNGRGRSARQVTPLDAARLLISLLASGRATGACEAVRRVGGFHMRFGASRATIASPIKTFEQAVAELLSSVASPAGCSSQPSNPYEIRVLETHDAAFLISGHRHVIFADPDVELPASATNVDHLIFLMRSSENVKPTMSIERTIPSAVVAIIAADLHP